MPVAHPCRLLYRDMRVCAPVSVAVGNYFGSKALESKLIKREYIAKTEEFYTKYGGKTGRLGRPG